MPERAAGDISGVTAVIDDERDAMCRLLAELVAIPSENPPGAEYGACVSTLRAAVNRLGLPCELVNGTEGAVLRAWVGDAAPILYFHGHYDVVPAASPAQFTPEIDGDTLFGRGSSDMKSGLVSMLYAAHALDRAGVRLKGRLSLVFVPDEETGGARGSAALAAAGELGRDGIGMLLPEPTSGRVWHTSRGAISLTVTVPGRAAHVGLQHQGINAVERSMPILQRLFELKHELDARGSLLLVGGRLNAGWNFNVVPDECTFTVDRRTNPDEDFEAEKRRLLSIIEAAAGGGVTVSIFQEGASSSSPTDGRIGDALSSAIAEVTGEPAVYEMCPGLLETRFYAERRIPAYAYGPGILAVSHGPKEFVRLSRMIECAKIYALTAARLLS